MRGLSRAREVQGVGVRRYSGSMEEAEGCSGADSSFFWHLVRGSS